MAHVSVRINGKTYRMACDDGEEDRLAGLAHRLDQSIEQLRARFGDIGEQRLTVMAAITLADQHAEAERRLAAAEAEIAGLQTERADLVADHEALGASVADTIGALAERMEAVARRMVAEESGNNGG